MVPLVILLLGELLAGVALGRHDGWYDINTNRPPDVLVIGSSRVEAGVNPGQLSNLLTESTGTSVRVENQGRGGSSIATHYLAVRDLLERLPADERAITVVIEAPGGVPAQLMRRTWSDAWVDDEYVNLLARFIESDDLDEYWAADQGLQTELRVTGRWAFRNSNLVGFREQWRDQFFSRGGRATSDVLGRLSPGAFDSRLDDAEEGAIFTDALRLREAVEHAERLAANEAAGGAVIEDWEGYIVADLVDLVESYGGQVVFFTMPVSSGFRAAFTSEAHVANRASFDAFRDSRGLTLLELGLELDDALFPDLWHLGVEGTEITTAKLGAELTASLET